MTDGVVRTLVALEPGVNSDSLREALASSPELRMVAEPQGLAESSARLGATQADLLIVACAGDSRDALELIGGAVRQRPERAVVVLCEGSPNGFVQQVFDAGADDLVVLPERSDRIRFALHKALVRKRGGGGEPGAREPAPMVCVLGPKGGTGKTLTSCNLGVSIAETGKSAVLIDLDLQFGDVGLALAVTPERTIYDLARSGGSLDAEKVDAYLTPHPSGLRLLLAPTRPDQASAVTVPFLREVFALLRSMADYVIVDTSPGFTPEVIAAIDCSSHVCLVGMLDSLSLKNTKLGLETLSLMGYDSERIHFVMNRADSRVGISMSDVSSILGSDPDIFVPSDRDIPVSVNEGVPIVLSNERSEAARAFRALAALYLPQDVVVPTPKTSGRRLLLGRKA